jgi:predicted RNase H-like nuclease
MKTVGIDGCPLGWLAIDFDDSKSPYWIIEDKEQLAATFEEGDAIFIDIPIGIPDETYTRDCDQRLKEELGSQYYASVFNPPVRPALYAPTYAEACIQSYSLTDKKVSLQAWNISAKIRQVDQLLQNEEKFQQKVYESHPELLFKILNGMEPIQQKKQIGKGLKHRLKLLKQVQDRAESIYREIKEEYRRKEVAEDDIVDAMVLAHFAQLSKEGAIEQLPENPPSDSKGISMAIHYVSST